jgi:hypothetical protein
MKINNETIYRFMYNNLSEQENYFKTLVERDKNNDVLTKKGIAELIGVDGIESDRRYIELMNGDGQTSYKRFATLNSSSLLSFLVFANITNKNKLTLKHERDTLIFNKIHFEYKNEVPIKNKRTGITPNSNIDVVLLGENQKRERIILFLESKFVEYHKYAKPNSESSNISKEHIDEVKKCFGSTDYLCSPDNVLSRIDGTSDYYDGVKQMITHNKGICNFKKGNFSKRNVESNEKCNEYYNAKTYYAEVLFYDKEISDKTLFDRFQQHYKDTIKVLKKYDTEENIQIHYFDNVLTYKEIINQNPNYKMHELIRKMYNL